MTASLQASKKDGKYYIYLSWKQCGKRKQKCIGTGLEVKGRNKRKAELLMKEILEEWSAKIPEDASDILFSDYLSQWLEEIKGTVAKSTHSTYSMTVNGVIGPWFKKRAIALLDLEPQDIQTFYTEKLNEGVSPNTIIHYHSYIRSALKHAIDMRLIKYNPSDGVKTPKKVKHRAIAHSMESVQKLIDAATGTDLEAPVVLAAMFGARRGEIIGLRWSDIDLENKTMSIENVIAKADVEFFKDMPKNSYSIRSFPLTDEQLNFFKELLRKKAENKRRLGKKYYNEDDDFVCIDDFGHRLKLDYVTRKIPKLSEQIGIERIKMHELRHSNISYLLASGASINEVQQWAGHNEASTTINIYGHAMGNFKNQLAKSIGSALAVKPD